MAQFQGGRSRGLTRIFLLVEAYPELKADRGFLDLQGELARIEDRIQLSRRY